jgi:DNA-directed RNA polymerases I, II, and III subunit RPABC5
MYSYINNSTPSTPLLHHHPTMIIPIKCFTCGKVLADKYRYYLAEVRKIKLSRNLDVDKVIYLTAEYIDKTPEGEVMDALGLTKMCCRRHMLTHVDIV